MSCDLLFESMAIDACSPLQSVAAQICFAVKMGAGGSCVHGHVQVRATANPHWHVPVQSVQAVQVPTHVNVQVRTHVPAPVSPPVPCSPVIPVSCPCPVKWDVGISAEERIRIQQWAAQVSSQVGFTVSPSMYWTCHSMNMDVLSGLSAADRWRMQHFLSGHCGHCCSSVDAWQSDRRGVAQVILLQSCF